MKKYINKIIILVAFFCCSGCDDFLDVKPSTKINLASTLDDYKALLYDNSRVNVDERIGVMGDEVYWNKNFYVSEAKDVTIRRSYLREDIVFDLTIKPGMWESQYNNIYTFNKIIDEVMDIQDVNEILLKEIKAEAHLYRALNYFHLMNFFTKPYSQASDVDMGIPFVLENDVTATSRPQMPIKDAYQAILSDIDTAILILPNYSNAASRLVGSRVGALGLKARVYFNMGDYNNSLTFINEVFDILNTNTSDLSYGLLDYNNLAFDDDSQPWKGLNWMASIPGGWGTDEDNIESIFTCPFDFQGDPTTGDVGFWPSNGIFVSSHLLNFFQSGDLRAKFMLYERNYSGNYWDDSEPGLKLKKMGFSNQGVTMPDLYLMAAECYVRNHDVDNAINLLNKLRKNRISSDVYEDLISADEAEVLKWILEERVREFIATGHRWYDMRRLWDDPIGSTLIDKNRVLDGEVHMLTKERLTVKIPEYIMKYNKEWIQNY